MTMTVQDIGCLASPGNSANKADKAGTGVQNMDRNGIVDQRFDSKCMKNMKHEQKMRFHYMFNEQKTGNERCSLFSVYLLLQMTLILRKTGFESQDFAQKVFSDRRSAKIAEKSEKQPAEICLKFMRKKQKTENERLFSVLRSWFLQIMALSAKTSDREKFFTRMCFSRIVLLHANRKQQNKAPNDAFD